MFKTFYLKAVAVAAMGLAITSVGAADVALVTALQGKVVIVGSGGASTDASPFVRLSDGATLRVGSGARVQVTYFDNGRQESWPENTQFKVEGRKGVSVQGQPANVRTLPQMVLTQLRDSPVAGESGRVGAVRVRAVESVDNLLSPMRRQEIENNYTQLRAGANGEVMPEVYRLTAYFKAGAYADVRQLTQALRDAQGANPDFVALAQRFDDAVQQATADQPKDRPQ